MRFCAIAFLFACPALFCQDLKQPVTQVEACRKFRASIVQVDSDTMHGTGFIVGSDGWVITALHVVADPQTLVKRENIVVSILGHSHSLAATIVSDLDDLARLKDFAILKIDESDLPALDLGNELDIEDGSPVAVIGIPLSASFGVRLTSTPRFCLAGTVAAQSAFPLGGLNFLHTVYFQGVSIKGISGAPIISLQTGKVIGVVSTRLTGISTSLSDLRDRLNKNGTGGVAFSGIGDPGKFALDIIDVMDTQLANGLGSGTGAADAKYGLEKAKRQYERQHPKK